MAVTRRSFQGIAWAATSGWTQLAIGVLTFAIVAQRLTAAEIGSFGVVTLLVGCVEMATCAPLGEGLQQRRALQPAQLHATFWVGLMLTAAAAVALAACAAPIARAFSTPLVATFLPWAAISLPLASVIGVLTAMLARDLRFGEIARVDMAASLASAAILLAGIHAGAGVWSLLVSVFAGQVVALGGLWRASRYRPAAPRGLGAIGELMRFNLGTLGIYVLGYADRVAPRLLTGFLLGPAPLGYLIVAQRVLDLLHQLVLAPLNSVTMAAVARLQDDRVELRRLVLSLYRVAALLGYPAFLGAVVLVADLALLLGAKWQSAVLATQILLLVGLRTTTGMFNIPILRGVGRNAWPLALLGGGLGLNLLLVPIGARYGTTGVAVAILLRTLATWPLGCLMVRWATGIGLRDQAATGLATIGAALAMTVATAAMLASLPPWVAPLPRLVSGALFGAAFYIALLAAISPTASRAVASAARSFARGRRLEAVGQLRAGFGF